MTDEQPTGVPRRSFLRSTAVAGSAALWAVPAVQVLGMSSAHAQNTSSVPAPPKPAPRAPGAKDGKAPKQGTPPGQAKHPDKPGQRRGQQRP